MEEIIKKIQSVKLCLMAHPDNEPDSEFEDRISDLEDLPKELQFQITKSNIEGVLTGLKICKELWAQGTISHESILQNEKFYTDQLDDFN